MFKSLAGLVAALALLSGCGAATALGPAVPATGVPVVSGAIHRTQVSRIGWLRIEPVEMIFFGTRPGSANVHVFQPWYRGGYAVENDCRAIDVQLMRYTHYDSAVWTLRQIRRAPRGWCSVKFFGSAGLRGKGLLRVRIL